MAKSSGSFRPGRSGNPGGRPKGIRTLARLIDSVGDETSSELEADYRSATIRRLWQAAATGRLKMGETSQQLKNGEWIELVQWLIQHMDRTALEQWRFEGQKQAFAEAEFELVEGGDDELEAADEVVQFAGVDSPSLLLAENATLNQEA